MAGLLLGIPLSLEGEFWHTKRHKVQNRPGT